MPEYKIVKILHYKFPGQEIYGLYENQEIVNFAHNLTDIKILAELLGLDSEKLLIEINIITE